MTKKTGKGNKRWTTTHEQTIVDILKNQSQINVTEFASSIGFMPSSVKRHISRIADSMGLRIVGISNRDVCDIKKSIRERKPTGPVYKFICKCTGPDGAVNIKVRATDKAYAQIAVQGEYPVLTVTHVFTIEEHNRTNRVHSDAPLAIRDVKFGKARSKKSNL